MERTLGTIGNEQMRPLSMAYDPVRGDVIIATTAGHGLFTGALTFAHPLTGDFEVRRDLVPDQNLRNIAVVGDLAYAAGDTYAEASSERLLMVATITEIDLTTRTVTRTFTPREWESYENVLVEDGILDAYGRRPNGAWFAMDLETEEVIAEGETGGYGGMGALRGTVYTWGMHGTDLAWFPLPR